MTGLDLITGALKLIGAYAPGESLSSTDANDALSVLNDLIDGWSNESLIVFPVVRDVFAFSSVGLQQTYTWGSSANLNSARPMRIKTAIIQLTAENPAIELPMQILNQEEYASVVLKTLQSTFPLYCYIDDAYPSRNVSVWPVPTDSTNSLVFYSTKPLSEAALNTALSLPPGYLRALRFNLAVDLAPEYGKPVPDNVIAIAVESKAVIKRSNTKPSYLKVDSALRALPSVYNWRTDGYEK